MNNLLLPFALITGLLAGCQPSSQPTVTAAARVSPPAARLHWVVTQHLPPAGPADTLTAAARALLRTHNLAPLWANADYDEPAAHAMEGFYGPDYYRIAFYFDEVRRDSLHPERFWVRGRNRYRKIITPFHGTITVRAIFRVQLDTVTHHLPTPVPAFVVRAGYELREDPTTKRAGVYRGEAMLDACETPPGELHQSDFGNSGYYPLANQDGGLTFRGTWTDNQTGRQCPAAWSPNLQRVTPLPILEEEMIGSRTGNVSPVLVRHGWNELWENAEWWAAPKGAASKLP